ncbi:hypothetical protein H6P81_009964 [Aristolochia fimbriata]|uniref:Aminotransferase-like plant mobile domain-containing protein n=1 Tax=Aristolochia fimbriata TaxID=158543 RepID=A0AAV7EN99_ARIFI|nr:hypothetical protein H6P81_009964 [Aristolochia fimbriata]
MMYNVLGGNPRTDHISIWLSFTCNGRLMYTPVLDDVSLENGIGMVKHGFQSMLELFVKEDTYSYGMDSRRSLENVGGTGEGAVMVYGGQPPAEGDERVERPITEFIPEEREPSEEANDNSSSEGSWPEPVTEEDVEEEEDVELPLLTMGVPPLEENDDPYPDPWIGVMDMDVTYRNTMVPGVDDDNVPPPVGVGVGQRFMTKDAIVMFGASETVAHYDHEMQILEEACPGAKAELTEDMSPEQWALAYDGNMSFGKLTINSSESVNSLLKRARSLPVQALASAIFYRMNSWFVHRRDKAAQSKTHLCPSVDAHLQTVVDDARHVHVVAYGDGIFQAGEHKVVMADAQLLYDQDSHRSEAIWHGEDPGCLECTEHFQTLRHWPMDERMLPNVEAAGFGALHRVQWLILDKPLITALEERWRSETNTFHLANGEMTITLEDVVVLLGLRVDGDAVTGSTRGDWMELARVFLGVELPPGSFQGGRLSLSWLRGQFSFCPNDATELVIQQHACVPPPSSGCDDILGW